MLALALVVAALGAASAEYVNGGVNVLPMNSGDSSVHMPYAAGSTNNFGTGVWTGTNGEWDVGQNIANGDPYDSYDMDNLYFLAVIQNGAFTPILSTSYMLNTSYASIIDLGTCRFELKLYVILPSTNPNAVRAYATAEFKDGMGNAVSTQTTSSMTPMTTITNNVANDSPATQDVWVRLLEVKGIITAGTREYDLMFYTSTSASNPTGIQVGFDDAELIVNYMSSLHGDPHFVGFDGSKFNFDGVSGEVFSIISDPSFELNARFERMMVKDVNGTWISEVGAVAKGFSMVFNPRTGVLVNENFLVSDKFADAAGNTVVVSAENGVISSVVVESTSYAIMFTVQTANNGNKYLDMTSSIVAIPSSIHGILGQTASFLVKGEAPQPATSNDKQGAGVIQGKATDYQVHDGILGTDFTYNQYLESVAKKPSKVRRGEPIVATIA
jgi:hypothetical protein